MKSKMIKTKLNKKEKLENELSQTAGQSDYRKEN